MIKRLLSLFLGVSLSACAVSPKDIAQLPHMTPIGSGVQPTVAAIPTQPAPIPARFKGNSFWDDSSANLFKDPRARHLGDVLTVEISISDKASLDNSSNRSREGSNDMGLDYSASASNKFGQQVSGSGSFSSGIDSKTEHTGKGAIARSETIELRVAAVVTDVLPNNNLIISGSQEVRVNYEVRVLNVSGIVNPRHITAGNTIAYDRIAEARISYGGRGRITEVQQPGWGHQLLDIISPF